ncbi:MAG: hypothetical protein IKB71_04160, partial [Lentisphaeria bacterium]|nr:hypothetical protein [Lentisphaeria bacterium]
MSEELLLTQKREEKTCVFVRHFFAKKMLLWDLPSFHSGYPGIFSKKNGGERGIRHGAKRRSAQHACCVNPRQGDAGKFAQTCPMNPSE